MRIANLRLAIPAGIAGGLIMAWKALNTSREGKRTRGISMVPWRGSLPSLRTLRPIVSRAEPSPTHCVVRFPGVQFLLWPAADPSAMPIPFIS
jgi:hypothetical protein